jgi:hypothetical protein
MKLLARVGGGEERGTKVVDKIGAPVSLLLVAFFGFLRLGFLAGIFGSEKSGPAGPLIIGLLLDDHCSPQQQVPCLLKSNFRDAAKRMDFKRRIGIEHRMMDPPLTNRSHCPPFS